MVLYIKHLILNISNIIIKFKSYTTPTLSSFAMAGNTSAVCYINDSTPKAFLMILSMYMSENQFKISCHDKNNNKKPELLNGFAFKMRKQNCPL